MKRTLSILALSALFLTACGTRLSGIYSETLKTYPEVKGIATSWQNLVNAAEAEDCEKFLTYMRGSLLLTEEACPAAFEYFANGAPEIDWTKTEWTADGGKAKIFKAGSGSLSGFILNTATDVWGADTVFWE